ncbi:hypothetical protein [Empedobacter tilapiae]|uniref:hypothetical protein n=1 Tax=Empedobacter tilapiae TaxID=2491114 RepID=UPI0028D507E6|nr:hypothetical protein [Empedobacter tilapiae]
MKITKLVLPLFLLLSCFTFSQQKKKTTLPPPKIKKVPPLPAPPKAKLYEPTFNNEYFIWKLEKDSLLAAESPYEIVLQVNDYSAFMRINSYPEETEYKSKVSDKNGDIIARTILMQANNYDVEIKNNILELKNRKTNEVTKFKIIKKSGKIIQLQDLNSKLIFTKDDKYEYYAPPSF